MVGGGGPPYDGEAVDDLMLLQTRKHGSTTIVAVLFMRNNKFRINLEF